MTITQKTARASLNRLIGHGVLASNQAGVLEQLLDRFWKALPSAARVLNHGDWTFENAIWHEGRVVALLDFEFAVIAPVELDLNELVKCAFAPSEWNDPLPDPDGAGLKRMRAAVTDLAIPLLSHPGGKDLLTGYAILLELWLLEDWLAHPEGEGPLEGWQPYRMLVSLAGGGGGYLAPLLTQLGILVICDAAHRKSPIIKTLNNLQEILAGQFRERGVRLALVPEGHRGDVILHRQVPAPFAPAQCLDRHPQVLFEADGVHDVPAVHAEALLAAIQAIRFDHLAQAGVGR